MATQAMKRVVIAGGGTAGWMTAAAMSRLLGSEIEITLVESDQIGTVGVGEATIPVIDTFHQLLKIDEQEFMRETSATFKLGIEFSGWGKKDDKYFHSFGVTGKQCWAGEFHHFWLSGLDKGVDSKFGDYCLELQAALAGKFARTTEPRINYAYHLDATAYARYLRKICEQQGVARIEGKIDTVSTNPLSGDITHLTLGSGEVVEGDLFIDCTGFKGLLIEETLHTGYDDWSHWLICDSAVAVQTESEGPLLPYTKSTAHEFGWQWKIPLQHRTGNGIVYSSKYVSDEDARQRLIESVDGPMITEPRVIKFKPGMRRKAWNKNCVAFGLASGFIEPLESTSIHLIMSNVIRFLRLFPFNGIKESARREFNKHFVHEMEMVREFIVLHYTATQRDDSGFWRYCRDMDIPEGLRHKLELFKETGRIFLDAGSLFTVDSWIQVMIGQNIIPEQYHKVANLMSDEELTKLLMGVRSNIQHNVSKLPTHEQFIAQYCKRTVA